MKTEKELNKDILDITLSIHAKHPELAKYIEEMPITIPNTSNPEVNLTNLADYYDSLQNMVKRYTANQDFYIPSKASSFFKLAIAISLCLFVGFASSLLSQTGNMTWYNTLNKPSWNPPSYIFAPVWTCLYALMGVVLWVVWEKPAPQKTRAMSIFAVQLFLNFCWSILFFRLHLVGWAYLDIILLLASILITIFWFGKISRTAALLLFPYFAWVLFASILNYTIWTMNF